ncbi:hypothetical protein SCLCIDRAFT_924921 [Scleroderma citrinum Foug A]|uniref:Uncharacterized protein n=1 Tax=Scleroderma citrinum Foug A TaxID=1036808 RepID=A0A0C2ZGX9_9AGAM|nr:hypothetical protein SCLCIDRAFT_924921 [Scleroderma citrinum Foug A]
MSSVGSFACLGETNFEHAPQKKCHDMHEMVCSFKVVKCLASAVAKELSSFRSVESWTKLPRTIICSCG